MADLSAFAEVRRAIVIAAHPDDLETMMGGTAALLATNGVEIISVNLTGGDIGSQTADVSRIRLAATREAETRAAAAILGVSDAIVLPHPDGELEPTLSLRATVAGLYRRTQADTVFTFDPSWSGQIHPDHRAAGRVALDSFMPSKMPLYHPEQLSSPEGLSKVARVFLFSPASATFYIDVTEVYAEKVAACLAHASQFPDDLSLDWMRELDREHGQAIGVEYAEAFAQLELW